MTEKYLWAGGAAVAGIVLGFVMDTGGDTTALVTDRMDGMQAELAAALQEVTAKVDEVNAIAAGNEAAIEALAGGVEVQVAKSSDSLAALEAQTTANATTLEAVGSRLAALADTQAGLTTQLTDGLSAVSKDVDAMRGDMMAAMKDTLAAAAAAVGAGVAPAPAPETAVAAAPAPVAEESVSSTAAVAQPDAEATRLADLVGSEGVILSVGQTATVGTAQVFLSRLSEAGAHLRIRGMDPVTAPSAGAPVDLGTGCALALAGIAGGKAYMTQACHTPDPATPAAELPAPVDLSLSIGQTGLFGDMRVFLSRLDPETGTAHLRLFTLAGMRASAAVSPQTPYMLDNGCGVAVTKIASDLAYLHAACGDAATGLSDLKTEVVVPAPEPAALSVETPDPEPRLADALSDTGLELRVGQTATVGDARLFVQRLPDNTAAMMVVGQGPVTLDVFRPIDLGNGCSVSLLGVQDGAAYLEPACAD